MNREQQTIAEPSSPLMAGRIEALRKMRVYYLQSLVGAANEIASIDAEIERLNMQTLGDGGL